MSLVIWANDNGSPIVYALLYMMLMILPLARIYLIYSFKCVTYAEGQVARYAEKASPFFFEATLWNESHFCFGNIEVKFLESELCLDADKIEHLCLTPGEKEKCERFLVGQYRGRYEVGVQSICVTDFLSLFSKYYPVSKKHEVIILPQIVKVNRLKGYAWLYKQSMQRRKGEVILDNEIGPYQKGDLIRQIHWKASAKKGELVSRKYVNNETVDFYLYMDLGRLTEVGEKRKQIEDRMVETMLACLQYILLQGATCEVILSKKAVEKRRFSGQKALEGFRKECALLSFEEEGPMITRLQSLLMNERETGKWFLILHQIDDRLILLLEKMAQQGLQFLIWVIGEAIEEEKIERLRKQEINIYQIGIEGRLTKWLEEGESQAATES